MSEGPKLYTHKPRKSQLKAKDFTSPSPPQPPSSVSSTMETQVSSTPPPQPPKEPFLRRNRFLVPLLLTANLAVGAYVYLRTSNKKEASPEEQVAAATPVSSPEIRKEPLPLPLPISEPVKLPEPIPENEQRELFKWILEEKRNVKPSDRAEKKKIDEEKAILKEFIKAKSIPTI